MRPRLIQPGEPVCYSWNQYQRAVEEIAAGLRALGLGKGDMVALNSETRLEFYLADLGIVTNGSVAAAMYPSYPPKDLLRTLESRREGRFRGRSEHLSLLQDAPVRHWILLTGRAEGVLTLDDLREMGREAMAAGPGLGGAPARGTATRKIPPFCTSLPAPPASPRWRW